MDNGYTDLVSIEDDAVESFLKGLIANVGNPECVTGSMGCPWIGYNAELTGAWAWSDGTVASYENWSSIEPSGDGACVHMNRYAHDPGWNDAPCDGGGNDYGYVCERGTP